MKEPLKVGLIGYGLAGESFHAPLIEAEPQLELVAVVTSDVERSRRLRSRHPNAEQVVSAQQLWDREIPVDLVVVASSNDAHVELARAALTAGVPVVVDKPLAPSSREALELIGEAADRGLMLTSFHNRRWDGDFLTVAKLIEDGSLGEVTRFESRFERWRPDVDDGWRESASPEAAGGVLFDLGPHLIDQALLLFGPAANVYGEVAARRPDAAVADDAFVAITHETGVVSHLWMSSLAAAPGPRLRVLGTRAAYVKRGLDVQEDALRAGEAPSGTDWGREPESAWGQLVAGDVRRPVPTRPGDYRHFYAGVAESLRTGSPPPVDPVDAVAGLLVIEAAQTASRSPQPPAAAR
ncbi:MAG: Gfo/Idh/MocA family oxidoreductase [Solirubrobacterales bacterium]